MEERFLDILDHSTSLGKVYDQVCRLVPESTAMTFRNTRITYSELQEKVNALATALLKSGITAEDRIAVLLPTRPEFVYVWLAASKIGASIVGLNYRYSREEVVYMVQNTEPGILICINHFADVDYAEFLKPILFEMPSLKQFIFLGETDFSPALDLESLVSGEPDTELLQSITQTGHGERDNFIIHTSGTTGKPKGAVIKQRNILAMLRSWMRNIQIKPADNMFCMLPLNHVGGGTITALTTLAMGAHLVMVDAFDPQTIIDDIRGNKITILGGVPTIFEILFAIHPDLTADMFPDLQLLIYGGSPASEETIKAMNRIFGADVMACYGASEVSGFCSYTRRDDPLMRASTAGKPGKGVEMKIVDPLQKSDSASDQIGEVAVRSEMVFDRYLNLPEETADSFSEDGWFYTGDLGRFDDDGYLVLSGRSKEMYINGGFNVYPKEIEDKLSEHPGVSTVAIIGIPHETKGEVGCAFVIPKPGTEISEEELIEFCRGKMADYKVPSKISIQSTLPMTPLGKILKSQLKETFSK